MSFCWRIVAILALAAWAVCLRADSLPAGPALPAATPAQAQGADASKAPAADAKGAPAADAKAQRAPNPNLSMMPELEGIEGEIGKTFLEKNWGYLAGALACVAIAAYFVFRRKKRAEPTPFEIAMAQLKFAQERGGMLGAKEYAERVSLCVREYIESVHKIPAPERTTEEFLRLASESKTFDLAQREQLAGILRLSDMAKFAMHAFKEDERLTLINEARNFVEDDNKKMNPAKRPDAGAPEGGSAKTAKAGESNAGNPDGGK